MATRAFTKSKYSKLNIVSLLFILTFSIACTGCNAAGDNKAESKVKAQATADYWDKFNNSKATLDGLEVTTTPKYNGNVSLDVTLIVLQDMINAERRKCGTISALPVLNVDPDAANFAADSVRSRLVAVEWLQGTVDLLKRQSQIFSAPYLGMGFMLNLLSRSDEKDDGIFWRALLDQAKSTGADIKGLEEPAKELSVKYKEFRRAMDKLRADEINIRVKLSERYGREFPSYLDYLKNAKPLNKGRITENVIMTTLVGASVGDGWDSWRFDATSEFQTFKIVSEKDFSDVEKGYDVLTHVRGVYTGAEHDFKLQVKYGWIGTRWFLIGLRKVD